MKHRKTFLLVPELDMIWYPVFRSGTKSIATAIAKRLGIKVEGHPLNVNLKQNRPFINRFVRNTDPQQFALDYRHVIVTRNPYDRYRSVVSHHVWKENYPDSDELDQAVEHGRLRKNKHFIPQWRAAPRRLYKGKHEVYSVVRDRGDFLKFRLEEGLDALGETFGLEIAHEHKSDPSRLEAEPFSESRIAMIKRVYVRDFGSFGYPLDMGWSSNG